MPEEPKKLGMYGWYDPGHLLETGVRVGIATIFGEFLDRRELFGDRNSPGMKDFDEECDYSKKKALARDELWLDFVADSGDGWRPALAVARLLALPGLNFQLEGGQWRGVDSRDSSAAAFPEKTSRGEVLIFGGDEVYATASREEYKNRLQHPFDTAARLEGVIPELKKTDVFALPGNHDWYDGLNAFMGLFVARRPGAGREGFGTGREVGYRRTKQTRSYFALKLPGNWWLVGVDAQLTGYIDQGQISFFDDLAQQVMDDRSNIIMCAATPSWSYVGLDGGPEEKFRNHAFFEQVITGMAHEGDPEPGKPRRHNLRLVLTGDSHHYARYMEGANAKQASPAGLLEVPHESRCYLTWGGGGAFMHPTQQLRDVEFDWYWAPPPPVTPIGAPAATHRARKFDLRQMHPASGDSWVSSLWVPLFAYNNKRFSALMGVFGMIVAWALAGTASLAEPDKRLPDLIRGAGGIGDAAGQLTLLLLTFPWVLLTCVALGAALVYFSAAQRMPVRILVGALHFSAHLVAFFLIFLCIARLIPDGYGSIQSSAILIVATAIATALVMPTIMGFYLFVSLFFRRHWNEAFSSLRIEDCKGFLRLHIKDGAVTIYPIVMDTIPTEDKGQLKPRLIEAPIRIDGRGSRGP